MPFKPLLFFCLLLSLSCNNTASSSGNKPGANKPEIVKTTSKNPFHTINAIPLPDSFTRIHADSNSFTTWLRNVPLKEDKTVYLFDGRLKLNQLAQFAVLDISIANKNLQQCADAVMRLRAEYLFAEKKYGAIHFTDNELTEYAFHPPYTKENFMQYMEKVFGMCGSASLAKQLNKVTDFTTIQPGDVLIRGGFPGHAVIVMDVAENIAGKKVFMLAQSYMPAQNIHVLINPLSETNSPWYEVNEVKKIITPEYWFYQNELKRW
jgi:Domain of unknown function (4846)